jgi:diguanylate cyclase (GGDEF)-like protein
MPATESRSLFRQLKAAKRLPSPAGMALRVLELCRKDNTPVGEVAETMMADPALSARLLKYANSSIAGVGREVTSVRDAVLLLGLRAVKLTALGFAIATPDFQPRCREFDLHRFWGESFATATLARRIAADLLSADREEAFTAGLLAKVGRLALANGCPEEYSQALEANRAGQPLVEAEHRCLGLDHVDFGVQLLDDWGLPDVLIDAIRRQLFPNGPGPAAAEERPLVQTLRIAVELAPLVVNLSEITPEQCASARRLVEQQLKLDEEAWQRICEETSCDCREMAEWFDVKLDGPTAVFDLYAEAQEEATRVGMVAQLERTRALEENKHLLRRATTDGLTGVANRAKFDERMQEAVTALHGGQGHFALIMFDIDHFKKFNDTHGHEVGDLVLKHVARTVQSTLREVDLLARFGGEEFIILAPQLDQREACTAAARVRKCVEDLRIKVNGQILQVRVSVGLNVTTDYPDCPDAQRLLVDVDKQLYLSKNAGRNTWSYLGRSASRVARGAKSS